MAGLVYAERGSPTRVSTSSSNPTMVTRVDTPHATADAGEARPLPEGTRVGRYVVVGRLGKGGMGEVLAGWDPELDRRVALKLIGGRSRASAKARARLLREAQVLAKLSHPNVVAVFDVGTHDDSVFVAMEHIGGPTLAQWLAAGRGLSAAHAAGLVHRDFKPANVMIGDDGRVRVLDFGIARVSDDASSSGSASSPGMRQGPPPRMETTGPAHELTEAGMVMGTPGYMAPEQFIAGAVDSRTDQFAFCIVLYRALYGVPPFVGETYVDLGRAVTKGGVIVPTTRGVPRRIRQALARGLSPAPDDRFPAMAELLTELERGLGQRRRRLVASAGAGAVVAMAAAITWASTPDDPCRGLDGQLAEIWDDDRRAAVEAALLGTEASYAPDAAVRVREGLDAWATRWLTTRVDACEATRVWAEQSEHLMDLRVACLDRQREQLRATVELLMAADLQVVQHAVDVTEQLPDVAECADVERLTADLAPPDDATTAAAVEALRAELAHIDVLVFAGKYDEADRLLAPLLARAQMLGYAPLQAEAVVRDGGLMVFRGHAEEGLVRLDEALWLAIATGHAKIEATALITSLHVLGTNRPSDPLALRHVRNVEAVLERLGHPPELAARAEMNAGTVFVRRRELDEAAARYRRAIELADAPETQSIRIGSLVNLAMVSGMRGDTDAALELMEQTLGAAIERLGARHPSIAAIHHNLGSVLYSQGDHRRALEQFELAIALNSETLGPQHPEVGRNLQNLALTLRELGRTDEALESSRRGLEIKRATLGPDDPSLAGAMNNHGDLLLRAQRPREALVFFEESERILAGAPDRIYPLASLAEARLVLGEPERAVEPAMEALALLETASFSAADRGQLEFVVARVLWETGRDRAEARRHAERARESYVTVPGEHAKQVAEIEQWLAARAGQAKN
jgi:tetratricopeptide (TPR) repeat protein